MIEPSWTEGLAVMQEGGGWWVSIIIKSDVGRH